MEAPVVEQPSLHLTGSDEPPEATYRGGDEEGRPSRTLGRLDMVLPERLVFGREDGEVAVCVTIVGVICCCWGSLQQRLHVFQTVPIRPGEYPWVIVGWKPPMPICPWSCRPVLRAFISIAICWEELADVGRLVPRLTESLRLMTPPQLAHELGRPELGGRPPVLGRLVSVECAKL